MVFMRSMQNDFSIIFWFPVFLMGSEEDDNLF